MGEKKKKVVKTIKVDVDKCNGCRACEVACSAFHAAPKYSSNNPARARIRVIREGIRRMCLLQGFLSIQGHFQRTRFQTPSEMRHV